MIIAYGGSPWTLAQSWEPRIGAAIVIVLIAWAVAKVIKSLLAKAVDRLPLAARQNQTIARRVHD
jgi:hypothetical protein